MTVLDEIRAAISPITVGDISTPTWAWATSELFRPVADAVEPAGAFNLLAPETNIFGDLFGEVPF